VQGIIRRDLLNAGAAAGAGLWAVPQLVRSAYGAPVPVPEAARAVNRIERFADVRDFVRVAAGL
jgi:hypothetical protein